MLGRRPPVSIASAVTTPRRRLVSVASAVTTPRRRLVSVAVAVAVMVGACSGGGIERDGDRIVDGGDESVFDLLPGDCLDPDEEIDEQVEQLPAVPCWSPHTHEVFAVVEAGDPDAFTGADDLEVDVYPGESALAEWAERACVTAYPDYVGASYFDSDLFSTWLIPTLDGWADDDDAVVCVARTTGWTMATSVHCSGGLRGDLEVPAEPAEIEDDDRSTEERLADAYPVPVDEPCPGPSVETES